MDPITLILTALAAGAGAGVKDTASSAITDAYNGLKTLIQRKFGDHQKTQTALIDYEEDPETYEKPLRKILTTHPFAQDDEIITAAQHLMTLIQPQQASMGKYNIQNAGTVQGQVIGDHANVTQHFGDQSKG
jgi:hypothetical protein